MTVAVLWGRIASYGRAEHRRTAVAAVAAVAAGARAAPVPGPGAGGGRLAGRPAV